MPGGGERVEDLKVVVTRGPRLCGNCSGRGRECVRSKRPHLLQSWICQGLLVSIKLGQKQRKEATHHLARRQARPPPGAGIRGVAVIAFPPDAVRQLRRRIIRVDDVVRLARVRGLRVGTI